MKKLILLAIAATSVSLPALAATTVYNSQAAFFSALTTNLTDDYGPASGYAPGFTLYNNAAMSAVFGETKYDAFGWRTLMSFELNYTLNHAGNPSYCSGCNGSFLLDFTATSVGTASGVGGVGVSVLNNDFVSPGVFYDALVTFGDGGQSIYSNSSDAFYFGITSDRLIKSIAYGPNGGGATTGGNFILGDLTIGTIAGPGVPEPESWALMILGLGGIGAVQRIRARRAQMRPA